MGWGSGFREGHGRAPELAVHLRWKAAVSLSFILKKLAQREREREKGKAAFL